MTLRDTAHRHRYKILPAVLLIVAALTAYIYRAPLLAWFTGQPVGDAGGAATTASAGDLRIEGTLAPDPPRQQGNTLRLRVSGADGRPVSGARVSVETSMPAMGAMPEMRGASTVEELGDGRYDARFDLQMGGTWTVEVEIESAHGSATMTYTLTVGSAGLTAVGVSGAPPTFRPAVHRSNAFADPARARIAEAFDAYESGRALLAADSLEGFEGHARTVGDTLRGAVHAVGDAPPEARSMLEAAAEAADRLSRSTELSDARLRFGELSEVLVRLIEMDPRLAEGWHIFRCPMAVGFQKWFQRAPDIENPYMGQQMLTCGSASEWTTALGAPAFEPHDGHGHEEGEIAYWTCSMHPSVKQETPGTCPICNMDLTPVTREELETGVILVDAVRRQRIGVRTAPVERRALARSIRAVGRVAYDETRIHDVTMRVDGWIEGLQADKTGQEVQRGATLFTAYSPELLSAQQELIIAARGGGSLADAARQRLRLWGLTRSQIDEIARRGEPRESVAIRSPASGFVIEKHVFDGAHVRAGQLLYRIASLDRVWIEADVYEQDLPHVRVGQPVTVTLPYLPDRSFKGDVAYVYPYLAGRTRTGKVRVELDNTDGTLRPDMYANVELEVDLGEQLAVPAEAVIYTGPRRLVFVDLGEGRLRPQEIQVGARAGGWIEVRSGLSASDVVVTSGNFLVAAESRIRSAAEYWEATDDPD